MTHASAVTGTWITASLQLQESLFFPGCPESPKLEAARGAPRAEGHAQRNKLQIGTDRVAESLERVEP